MTVPDDLVPILDDLRVGLRRRAARRRAARAAAATALATLALAGVGISAVGRLAGGAGTASASAAVRSAADGLYGCTSDLACWPRDVNVPKHRSYPRP